MKSRMALKAMKTRSKLYWLVGVGSGMLVLLIAGLLFGNQLRTNHWANQAAAIKYAKKHFNANVKLYGTPIGNLTQAAAYHKINQKAPNTAVLNAEQGQVTLKRDAKVVTISRGQLATYFNKQHTKLPNNQSYTYPNQALLQAQNRLRAVNKIVISYQLPTRQVKFAANSLLTTVRYQNKRYQFGPSPKLTAKLNALNQTVSTLHKSYSVTVPQGDKVTGKTIKVKNATYGWGIWVDKAAWLIKQAMLSGRDQHLDGAAAIYGLGYSTYGLGYGKANAGLVRDYVVVSLNQQEVWIVKDGQLALHLTDVVTGTKTGDSDRTPTGVYYIHYKQQNATLRGNNDDGSKYASKVNYWMPFTLSGCGLHDASWRTDWSKTAYLQGGSHGCINIKPAEIRSVWDNVKKHEPVIIYN